VLTCRREEDGRVLAARRCPGLPCTVFCDRCTAICHNALPGQMGSEAQQHSAVIGRPILPKKRACAHSHSVSLALGHWTLHAPALRQENLRDEFLSTLRESG
jgi:hypothetical protein